MKNVPHTDPGPLLRVVPLPVNDVLVALDGGGGSAGGIGPLVPPARATQAPAKVGWTLIDQESCRGTAIGLIILEMGKGPTLLTMAWRRAGALVNLNGITIYS